MISSRCMNKIPIINHKCLKIILGYVYHFYHLLGTSKQVCCVKTTCLRLARKSPPARRRLLIPWNLWQGFRWREGLMQMQLSRGSRDVENIMQPPPQGPYFWWNWMPYVCYIISHRHICAKIETVQPMKHFLGQHSNRDSRAKEGRRGIWCVVHCWPNHDVIQKKAKGQPYPAVLEASREEGVEGRLWLRAVCTWNCQTLLYLCAMSPRDSLAHKTTKTQKFWPHRGRRE